MKGHRVLRRERLQACSDTAAYVFEDAAAEMAIDEVKKKKNTHTFVSSCVILNDFPLFYSNICTVCMSQDFVGDRVKVFQDIVFIYHIGVFFIDSICILVPTTQAINCR